MPRFHLTKCLISPKFSVATLSAFLAFSFVSVVGPTATSAQNLLVNGTFEGDTAANYGDNDDVTPSGWMTLFELPDPVSIGEPAWKYRKLLLVKVDGPNGQPTTQLSTIPTANAQYPLLDSDATHAGSAVDAHYVRFGGAYNTFFLGQRLHAPQTGCIAFGVSHAVSSNYHPQPLMFGQINEPMLTAAIANNDPAANNPAAYTTSQTRAGDVTGPLAAWHQIEGYAPVSAGGLYAWRYQLLPTKALDDAYVHYVDNSNCPTIPAGTPNPPNVTIEDTMSAPSVPNGPAALDPVNINLNKSCTAPTSVELGGEVGQMWDCSVDVTVPTAPFAGDLSVSDLYTPISTTTSNIASSSSISGNFDCTSGATCTIDGADFDATGTETLDYSVFVSATELQDTYPMQNCVEGSYVDGTGTATSVAGNCVSAQWIPRSAINKTCDPIDPVTSGPMTLNCQIEVTGTDLATESFVVAADAFAALPPVTATIAGTMMNVTSTEPWSCVDQNINNPGSIGICEISAADMLAAGGTSTLNVSFDFTTDQSSGQVVNCPMTDILPASFIGSAGQRKSAPTLRTPQTKSLAGLPDNCAIIDLPAVSVTPKLEDVSATKRCKAPELATVQGVTGYTWDCEAEVTVVPTPFAGTFTLEDDASQISIGAAQFVSTSDPAACSGLQTDHLTCVFDGTTMSAPQVVSYQLFTALTDANKPIEWQNCIEGIAQTAAGDFSSKPMCVKEVIKPEVEPPLPPEFALKKGCRLGGVQDGNAFYACTIYISQSSGDPITDPLIFDELFSTTSGTPATHHILTMQGTPAMPNGWACQQPPFNTGASCTISAADFNANTSHRIDAYLSIPAADMGKNDFQNCAQVRIGDQIVGSADCVEIVEPPVETTFDVDKSCKASGKRRVMGSSIWFQPYQCTLTVTTNGAPFTGPLWLTENLSFGPNPGATSISNITSADPWSCASPPYAPAGQGTLPACGINGVDFPASGSSTLTVDLMMNGMMDLFGAENCVSLNQGEQNDQTAPIASDCFEIAPPPVSDPSVDITKTCAPAARGVDGIWTAECEINVHFENFDTATNHQFYIYDELGGNGPQTPLTSFMPFNTMGMGGWGPSTGTPAGFNNATGMLLNYLQSDGSGTITQPYTATFSGPGGRFLIGGPITNCAWVTIPSLSLRAPAGPVGDEKTCVPITFPLSAVVDSSVLLDPAMPTGPVGPVIVTDTIGSVRPNIGFPEPGIQLPPVLPELTISKEQTGRCEADRTSQIYDCGFRLRVTNTGDGAYFGPMVVTDTGGAPGIASTQVVSGNGWSCGAAIGNAVSCSNPSVTLAPGASTYVDLRMKINALRKGGTFQNCAAVGVSSNRTDRVALIQKIMNDRGLNAGPVDGKPGQKTYTALSKLRKTLGLPDSRDFNDALFTALGLPLQKAGNVSCVTADLPPMPAPRLQCNANTTVPKGESCACRYDNMTRHNATSCQCVAGFDFIKGKGCVEVETPKPVPAPTPAPAPDSALQCDLRSTYKRGDICACIDHDNAKNTSATQCGCTNGLPMINGKCIPLVIKPSGSGDDVDGDQKCKIKLNGICIK
jgi:hypothetical protein